MLILDDCGRGFHDDGPIIVDNDDDIEEERETRKPKPDVNTVLTSEKPAKKPIRARPASDNSARKADVASDYIEGKQSPEILGIDEDRRCIEHWRTYRAFRELVVRQQGLGGGTAAHPHDEARARLYYQRHREAVERGRFLDRNQHA